MLRRIGAWAEKRVLEDGGPWTNVYGLGRSLLAVSSALTLMLNEPGTLFRPIAGVAAATPFCRHVLQRTDLYCLLASHLGLARWLAAAGFLLVASGWRPRFTGVLHWWLALGFQLSASTLEGGDQASAVLSLLLLPVTLTDPRRWHWQPAPKITIAPAGATAEAAVAPPVRSVAARLIAASAMLAVRLQVCGIYFHAAVGKLKVTEWINGTAMYYWLRHPTFGAPRLLRPLLEPLLARSGVVASLTWGTIVVETLLFMGLVATRPVRAFLLRAGIALHLGILLLMGLFTFSIAMFGALVLYLRPWDCPFVFPDAGRVRERLALPLRALAAATRRWAPHAPEDQPKTLRG